MCLLPGIQEYRLRRVGGQHNLLTACLRLPGQEATSGDRLAPFFSLDDQQFDSTIATRVNSVQNIDGWSKAGMMIRAAWRQCGQCSYRRDAGQWRDTCVRAPVGMPFALPLPGSRHTGQAGGQWHVFRLLFYQMASGRRLEHDNHDGIHVYRFGGRSHNNSSLCTATFDNVASFRLASAPRRRNCVVSGQSILHGTL
jgi:hypothetical protein